MQTLKLPSTITSMGDNAFAAAKQLHSVDMSKITGALTVEHVFNTWGQGDPVDCIFYVNNSSIRDTLNADNWGSRNAKKIFAVTNGGILPENVAFTAGKLATPIKDGYIFDGWYDNADFNGSAVTTAKAKTTYYAKWTKCSHTNISYTAKDNVITEACDCGHISNTLTLNAPSNLTYDGLKKECTIVKPDDWQDTSDLTIEYYSGENKLDEPPFKTGAYTAKVTVNDATASVDFTIAKATPAVAISATPSTLTGGGSVELTVSGVPTKGTLDVTCDNDITVTEKDGKYTATLPNETRDYTFKADYTGTNLYNNASDTCVVSVTYKGSSHHSSSSFSSSTSNTVSASTASNGKVSLDKSTAKKGDTVTVTVTPDVGYQLDKLTVTDLSLIHI